MLRTIVRMTLGAVAPPTVPSTRPYRPLGGDPRVAIPVGRGRVDDRAASNGRSAVDGVASPSALPHAVAVRTVAPMHAPWGELPALAQLAVVTTEPFPPEWWRRPRITPPPETPFVIEPHEASTAPDASVTAHDHSLAAASELVIVDEGGAPHRSVHTRGSARRRRGLFARICLVIAGALISFIVVDAASGRAHR